MTTPIIRASACGWVLASSLLCAQVSGPRAEHKALEAFVGVWNFAGEVAYTHINQMANGGCFLETRRTGTGPNGPVTELFVCSYNAVSRTYRQDGFNNRGVVRTFTGTVDGRTWTFSGTNTSLDGQVTKERFVLVYSPNMSSATVRSEHSKDGNTWHERLTGTYTRVSGSATGRSSRSKRNVVRRIT